MKLRSKTTIAILALLALLAATPALAGHGGGGGHGCHGDNLKILAVFVDAGLEIVGQGFDVGNGPLKVRLAGIDLTVNSADATTITADLPVELPIPGQYLLEVSNGKCRGKRQYDEFDLNIDPDCPCNALYAEFFAAVSIAGCGQLGDEGGVFVTVAGGEDGVAWASLVDFIGPALTCGTASAGGEFILPITPGQFPACSAVILQAAAAQGVECVLDP